MAYYEEIKGKPRLIVLGQSRNRFIDLSGYFLAEPYREGASVLVATSVSGRTQVVYKHQAGPTRLKLSGLDLEEVKRLQQLFRVFSARGVPFEVMMDRGRCMRIVGDTARDEGSWSGPFDAGFGIYYDLDPLGAIDGVGGIGVFPGQVPGYERSNCAINGDAVDGPPLYLPTGWVNETTGTLVGYKIQYLSGMTNEAGTNEGNVVKLQAVAGGAKTLAVPFDLGKFGGADLQYDSLPLSYLTLSFVARMDFQPDALAALNTAGSEVLSVSLRPTSSSSSLRDDITKVQLTTRWTRFFVRFQPTTAVSDNDGDIIFDFTDALVGHSVYLRDIRLSPSRHWTGPATYSTVRSEALGARDAGHLQYINRLHYAFQIPAWEAREAGGAATQFSYSLGFYFTPFWSTTSGSRGSEFSVVTGVNDKLDFDEGGGELPVEIPEGQYDFQTLGDKLASLMTVAAAATITVTYNVGTRKFTISSTGATFNLRWNTGTNAAVSIGGLLGYDTSADDTGATSYLADNADTGFLTLLRTADTTTSGNTSGLRIYATSDKIVAEFLLDDGSVMSLTKTGVTWVAGTPVHVAVTAQDWDGSTASSGGIGLWVDGSVVSGTNTHSRWLASLGILLLVGSDVTRKNAACGLFTDVRIEPGVIGVDWSITDFRNTGGTLPERFRHTFLCKVGKRGTPLVRFDDKNNAYAMDVQLSSDILFNPS